MITKEEIVKHLQNEFPYLQRTFNIKRIGLFGSYVTGDATEESDIDIVIEFTKPIGLEFMTLCEYLEKLFNKKVDVLTPEGIKSIRVKSVADNILNTIEYVRAA